MIEPANRASRKNSANARDFRAAFVGRVHEVLQQGYLRLRSSSYHDWDEPAITGELVKSMKDFLRSDEAPSWTDNFSVHDDPPVNDGGRTGKRRKRIDISVESSTPRPGNTFSFEAKRLAPGCPVAKYLGEDGLGCFLRGEYAREDSEGGMLGYVQSADAKHWAGEVSTALSSERSKFEVTGSPHWTEYRFARGPLHSFRSYHTRKSVGKPIAILHSFLVFTSKS